MSGQGESRPGAASRPVALLIILMGSIGDVVRGFALLPEIKKRLPGCHITWLAEPRCSGLAERHPLIDDLLVFDRERPFKGVIRLLKQLRERRFDAVLDLQRHFKSGLFSCLSRAPQRVGFNRADAKEFNWVFNNQRIRACAGELSKIEHYFEILRYFLAARGAAVPQFGGSGRSAGWRSGLEEVKFAALPVEWRRALPKKYAAVVLGSSWASKNWAGQGYAGMLKGLIGQFKLAVVLLGDQSQRALGEKLAQGLPGEQLFNFAGQTTLVQAAELLKGALFAVGPDSGPGHLAAAVGTPYVGLFGPTDVKRTAPHGCEHLAIASSIGCCPCHRRRCPGLNNLCMRLISVEAVLEKAAALIKRREEGQAKNENLAGL